jgi:hypothetical protein
MGSKCVRPTCRYTHISRTKDPTLLSGHINILRGEQALRNPFLAHSGLLHWLHQIHHAWYLRLQLGDEAALQLSLQVLSKDALAGISRGRLRTRSTPASPHLATLTLPPLYHVTVRGCIYQFLRRLNFLCHFTATLPLLDVDGFKPYS